MALFRDLGAFWDRLQSADSLSDFTSLAGDWVKYATVNAIRAPTDPLGGMMYVREVVPPGILVAEAGIALTALGVPPAIAAPLAIGCTEIDRYLGDSAMAIARGSATPSLREAVSRATQAILRVGARELASEVTGEISKRVVRATDRIEVRESGSPLEPPAALGAMHGASIRSVPGMQLDIVTDRTSGDSEKWTFLERGRAIRSCIIQRLLDGRIKWLSVKGG